MEERKFEIVNDYGSDLKEIRLRYKTNNEGTRRECIPDRR